MRVPLASLGLMVGCTFGGPGGSSIDALVDTPIDQPIDTSEPQRVRQDLVGFWTFDEAAGASTVADTSASTPLVPLRVETSTTIFAPVFENGTVRATTVSRVISDVNTHLNTDCKTANAVTLEVWAKPGSLQQGTIAEPRFIAGLGANIGARNIVLLQGADRWIGMVRTGVAQDGGPRMESTTAVEDKMTHLVLVADGDERTLYVDNVPQVVDLPGSLASWNAGFAMALFDEPQHARQWRGTLGLVAVYSRALTIEEIALNFSLGAAAP